MRGRERDLILNLCLWHIRIKYCNPNTKRVRWNPDSRILLNSVAPMKHRETEPTPPPQPPQRLSSFLSGQRSECSFILIPCSLVYVIWAVFVSMDIRLDQDSFQFNHTPSIKIVPLQFTIIPKYPFQLFLFLSACLDGRPQITAKNYFNAELQFSTS